MSRHTPVISRDYSFATERKSEHEPEWYANFIDGLEKNSVKSRKDDYSLYDQINSIVSDKGSKFSSVEAKVSDMVERTGLKKMLAQITNDTKQQLNAKAQLTMQEAAVPQVKTFASIPELKTFIDNYIDGHKGTSVEAVIHDALKINQIRKKLEIEDTLPEEVQHYISFKIGEASKDNNQSHQNDNQLGKVDTSVDKNVVDDPLMICQPARDGSQ